MRIGEIMKALFVVGCLVVGLGCATLRTEETAMLRVECNVPGAAVLLDDAVWGRVAQAAKQDKPIRPGFYRLEIRHPGYYSYFGEFTVDEGDTAQVKAELHPLLDD
jgi:protein-S-isoprenylcysteine O-methyltransferase Ste14